MDMEISRLLWDREGARMYNAALILSEMKDDLATSNLNENGKAVIRTLIQQTTDWVIPLQGSVIWN